MMNQRWLSDRIEGFLEKRKDQQRYRSLRTADHLIDFCSNDYLGLTHDSDLHQNWLDSLSQKPEIKAGSTGSRLLTGHHNLAAEFESFLAEFHRADTALLFNSGYDANLGLLSCVLRPGDVVFYDEMIHASMHDGMRMSAARFESFRHNDVSDLESKLQGLNHQAFVLIESYYSMDGDCCPLPEMVQLCRRYDAALILDEAHATGVWGPSGRGLASHYELEDDIFARIHTFGKSIGGHGAAILGADRLREYLINFSRPLIFTTAGSPATILHNLLAYHYLAENPDLQDQLQERIQWFRTGVKEDWEDRNIRFLDVQGPIQLIIIPGNEACKKAADYLQSKGFDIRPILSPTVPKGEERLRICLHVHNTYQEIQSLRMHLETYLNQISLNV